MSRLTLLSGSMVLLGVVASGPVVSPGEAARRSELAAPFAVTVGGAVLDVPYQKDSPLKDPLYDHANPWFGDFDGNGKPDLLLDSYFTGVQLLLLNTTKPGAATPTFTSRTTATSAPTRSPIGFRTVRRPPTRRRPSTSTCRMRPRPVPPVRLSPSRKMKS